MFHYLSQDRGLENMKKRGFSQAKIDALRALRLANNKKLKK
jgi:hypothetical protein